MNWFKPLFEKNNQAYLAAIALILLVIGILYIPTIGGIGFSLDAWYNVWEYHIHGNQGLMDSYMIDRPGTGLVYSLGFSLLGTNPIAWQVANLILHASTSICFFLAMQELWAKKLDISLGLTLIYALFPGYLQYAFFNHMFNYQVGLSLTILSFFLFLKGISSESSLARWIFLCFSSLAIFAAYFIVEIFITSLITIACFALFCVGLRQWRNWWRILLYLLPHFLFALIFLYWRLFLFDSTRVATNQSQVLSSFDSTSFLNHFFTSFDTLIFEIWKFPIIFAQSLQISHLLVALFSALLVLGLFILFLRLFPQVYDNNADSDERGRLGASMVIMSLPSLFISFALIALIGRMYVFSGRFDRYIIPVSSLIPLLIFGLIFYLLRPSLRLPALAIIIFTLGLTQAMVIQNQLRSWAMTKEVVHQILVRVPALYDESLMLILPGERLEGLLYANGMNNMINVAYDYESMQVNLTLEAYSLAKLELVLDNAVVSSGYRNDQREVNYSNGLIIYVPNLEELEEGECIRLISPTYPLTTLADNPLVESYDSQLDLSSIINSDGRTTAPVHIFGEAEANWCSYFQAADLAQQEGDWQRVAALYEELIARSIMPNQSYEEWFVYARAFFELGQVERVAPVIQDLLHLSALEEPMIQCEGLELSLTECVFHRYQEVNQDIVVHHFFDDIQLHAWQLEGSSERQACETLTLQSQWSVKEHVSENYSAALVLVESGTTNVLVQLDRPITRTEIFNLSVSLPYFDRRTLTIPCDAPAASYDLLWTIYDLNNSSSSEYFYLTTISIQD